VQVRSPAPVDEKQAHTSESKKPLLPDASLLPKRLRNNTSKERREKRLQKIATRREQRAAYHAAVASAPSTDD
jgi:hypothetical protein